MTEAELWGLLVSFSEQGASFGAQLLTIVSAYLAVAYLNWKPVDACPSAARLGHFRWCRRHIGRRGLRRDSSRRRDGRGVAADAS